MAIVEAVENGRRTSIRNTGVEISAEDLPHNFDRAVRVKRLECKNLSSGGLGLAIVKRIIESHDSQIQVETKEGAGTCFSFVLPYSQPQQRA